MFKRFRRLEISLAAKCQILFGAAVVLIIGATLAFPWYRMEELTEELNGVAGGVLADQTIAQHMLSRQSAGARDLTTQPATQDPASREEHAVPPRLLAISANVDAPEMTRFERQALLHFRKHPDSRPYTGYYTRLDGTQGFRFARAAYMTRSCMACHAEADSDRPSRLMGIVAEDFPSRTKQNQIILNRVYVFSAGLLAGTLAIIAFYLITTRLILQPVRVLQETAEKVSEGDLNIRSDISTGDEFQQLSETFNVMLANLKESDEQLRSVNKSLDIKLGQLAESNVALYESNRLKSEFLANVSHELRTPLNSILGFADLLKDSVGAPADSKAVRYINNILQSGRNLLDLINDLLDLAKIEAGRMEIRSVPLSLNDLFEGLTTIIKPLAEARNLSIHIVSGADVPIIQSDPGKLQQILYNFLSNAIKFSPLGSNIELGAQREGAAHVRIFVRDRGPGIALEKQQVIFEKFRQIDASVTRTHSGTGLGLAISKELTALLGGSIGVRSLPDEGATFWVLLPLRIEAGAMDVRARLVLSS